MSIPGSNILNMAFTVIAKQSVLYYKATGRVLNDIGQDVTTYAPAVVLMGSFQPVPRRLYQIFGLDLQKDYFNFYVSSDVVDVNRDVSGDQIAFHDERFQCESNTDWYKLDGWKGILCVRIGLDTADPLVFGFNQKPSINTYKNFNRGNFSAYD